MTSFNLVVEPWLPCLVRDGPPRELSLREALLRAHELESLNDASPLNTAALHRLLLAIVHRVFGPADRHAWAALWKRGHFPAEPLEQYLSAWQHRFDLFDAKRPFYQDASIDPQSAGPITRLLPEQASEGAPTLFDHSLDAALTPLAPSAAARALVAYQAFALGGTVSREKGDSPSDIAAPLVKGAVTLVRGPTLFHTLLLNAVRYDPTRDQPFHTQGEDRPAWEHDHAARPGERWPAGYLDYLTWQSRRIRLFLADEAGQMGVTRVAIWKGCRLPEQWQPWTREPMLAFKRRQQAKANDMPWLPVGFTDHRVLWRDSLALVQSVADQTVRPRVLEWVNGLVEDELLDQAATLPLDILGMQSNQARVLLWRHERLLLPLRYLGDEALVTALGIALHDAERVGEALRSATYVFAQEILAPAYAGRTPDRKTVSALVESLATERAYWAAIENAFQPLLLDLPHDRQEEDGQPIYGTTALPAWREQVRREARTSLARATQTVGGVRGLRGAAQAERALRFKLAADRNAGTLAPEATQTTDEEENRVPDPIA